MRDGKTERNGQDAVLVGIHQPHYLPWLRYFEKVARCDVFIVLDTVQFAKNGWQNRNKVKTQAGATLLTVPVHTSLDETLEGVRIKAGSKWRRKHWETIRQAYRKAPHFDACAGMLEETYAREWELLNDLNGHLIERFVEALGISTRIEYASRLDMPGSATERLVQLVRAVGGGRYYSGAFALEEYLDADLFETAGIGLELQDWQAPAYPQLHGPSIADLSIVDLLMNCGPDSLGILLGGDET